MKETGQEKRKGNKGTQRTTKHRSTHFNGSQTSMKPAPLREEEEYLSTAPSASCLEHLASIPISTSYMQL